MQWPRRWWLTVAVLHCSTLMLCCMLTSCSGNPFPGRPHKANIYLPYIESVTLPDEIHVGESFTLQIHVSMAQAPDVLNNPAFGLGYAEMFLEPAPHKRAFWLVLTDDDSLISETPGPIGAALEYQVRLSEQGTQSLLIGTTATRELGGSLITWNVYDNYAQLPGQGGIYSYREVAIEVLP